MGSSPYQPVSRDARALPPAVVAYLLNGAKISEAVFTRALLALGEEGWLRIEPEDAGLPVVRINRLLAPGELRPFEQLALERVVQRMGAATKGSRDNYFPSLGRVGSSIGLTGSV